MACNCNVCSRLDQLSKPKASPSIYEMRIKELEALNLRYLLALNEIRALAVESFAHKIAAEIADRAIKGSP